jgi:hypothetical protein
MILHQVPATQRYGYLAFPAVYVAAAEGVSWLAGRASRWTGLSRSPGGSRSERTALLTPAAWTGAGLILLAAAQLVQANADLAGVYRFAVAFGIR